MEMHMTATSGSQQIKRDTEMWASFFCYEKEDVCGTARGRKVDILFNVIEFNWQAGNTQLSGDTICI